MSAMRLSLRRYRSAFVLSLQTSLQYRVNSMFLLTLYLIRPLALFFLWRALWEQGVTLGTYSLASLFTYYLVTQFFVSNTPFMAWVEIGDGIRTGRLAMWLVRPASHYGLYLALVLGGSLLPWLVGLAGIAAVALLLGPYVLVQQDAGLVLAAALFWLGGVLLGFTFGYLLNLVAFWTQRVSGFWRLIDLLITFLSGSVIPLDLLPFSDVWLLSPFRFAGWLPAQIYLGRIGWDALPAEAAKLFAWLVVLACLAGWVWRLGLRRFQGAGI